jgi:hypothetical protein
VVVVAHGGSIREEDDAWLLICGYGGDHVIYCGVGPGWDVEGQGSAADAVGDLAACSEQAVLAGLRIAVASGRCRWWCAGRPRLSHREVRVRVAHAFARMKAWRILRYCRLKGGRPLRHPRHPLPPQPHPRWVT